LGEGDDLGPLDICDCEVVWIDHEGIVETELNHAGQEDQRTKRCPLSVSELQIRRRILENRLQLCRVACGSLPSKITGDKITRHLQVNLAMRTAE
jgi:hypothetical protein